MSQTETLDVTRSFEAIRAVKKRHMYIRLGLLAATLVLVIFYGLMILSYTKTFDAAKFAAVLQAELHPYSGELQQAFADSLEENRPEILNGMQAVINERQPYIRSALDGEWRRFDEQFPEQARARISAVLERQGDDYLQVLRGHFPGFTPDGNMEQLFDEVWADMVVSVTALTRKDMDGIAEEIDAFTVLTQDERVLEEVARYEMDTLKTEKLVGAFLRYLARQYPGAAVGFTTGKPGEGDVTP